MFDTFCFFLYSYSAILYTFRSVNFFEIRALSTYNLIIDISFTSLGTSQRCQTNMQRRALTKKAGRIPIEADVKFD